MKHGEFLGTVCDFYVDEKNNIYMSRTQIGYALEYKNPSKGIENVHNRNYKRMDKFSIKITGAQIEGGSKHIDPNSEMYMYIERGIYEICRKSAQPVADDFNDWVYDTIESIKKNGYYIASEKDSKWLGIRNESKQARRYETDQIKLFVEYAKEQGSKSADRYYVLFTKLINGKMGIQSGKRDELSQETLMELKSLETLVKMRIRKLMEKKKPYKKIYQDVKLLVEEF